MGANYLQRSRHGTTYFFRRRVPDDIRPIINSHQLYKSLCTTHRREAIILARRLAARTDYLFHLVRMGKKDNLDIAQDWALSIDLGDFGTLRVETSLHDSEEDKAKAIEAFKSVAHSVIQNRAPTSPSPSPVIVKAGKSLKEAISEYLAGAQLKSRSLKSYRLALQDIALPFFGNDILITDIDQERFAEFIAHIRSDTTKSAATIEGYAYAFTALFKWHKSRINGLPTLTTATLLPKQVRPEGEERDAFTLAHIKEIFDNARHYLDKQPCKYWITVATAMTGCRVEEISQINLATDLHHDPQAGIWYFDLNENVDEDGVVRKSLKRLSSWRVVPIHSALIEAGFIDFLQAQAKAGHKRPFESEWKAWLDPSTNGLKWSHSISKWGGRELEKLDKAAKVVREGLDLAYFHSMRHTFANTLAKQGVLEETRSALQGQQYGGINSERYAKLRKDHVFLSGIVEQNLRELAALLR